MTTHHTAFFGDAEYAFCLTPPLILELERASGLGIGLLAQSIFSGRFHHDNLYAVIRLALVGGGTTPQRAAELVDTYAKPQPLKHAHVLAVDILNALMNGSPDA